VVRPPSRFAVAKACNPATPTPSTNTVAGFTVPAAVVNIGKNRVDSDAASSTALYPATLPCDDNASIACARDIRGMASRANACTPAALSAPIELSALRGAKKPINV
jgi:hypothetical protein